MSRNVCLVVSGFAVLLINSSAIGVVIDPGEILKIDKKKIELSVSINMNSHEKKPQFKHEAL